MRERGGEGGGGELYSYRGRGISSVSVDIDLTTVPRAQRTSHNETVVPVRGGGGRGGGTQVNMASLSWPAMFAYPPESKSSTAKS